MISFLSVTFTIRYRHGNLHSYGILAFYFIIFIFFVQGEIDDFSGISYNFFVYMLLMPLKIQPVLSLLPHTQSRGPSHPPPSTWSNRSASGSMAFSASLQRVGLGSPPRSVLTLDAHEDYSGVLLGKFFWSDPGIPLLPEAASAG